LKYKVVLADKGYDSDKIIEFIESQDAVAVIPPKSNRKIQREYDKEKYKERNLVERGFLKLKRWRGIATRYAKNSGSFYVSVCIACINQWILYLL